MHMLYICPRCGKVFGAEQGKEKCRFCQYGGPFQSIMPYEEFRKSFDDFSHWRLTKEFQQKYVDHSSSVFDAELFAKREENDRAAEKQELEMNQHIKWLQNASIEEMAAKMEPNCSPHCPTCGSSFVHRIDKWESMFRKLQFECSKCGYQW